MLCIVAIISGTENTNPTCLKIEVFKTLFETPIFFKIWYLLTSSSASDICLKNIMLPVQTRNINPKNIPINIIVPISIEDDA
ncbi:hypothetical protein [Clostridium botulinum]|uniref:hypothetical protein n=1 Tax=Clostridium botulinum TaxID=1491 RepID=UPI001FA769EE|nr:hypothetical protein [Clostridium botulinum]